MLFNIIKIPIELSFSFIIYIIFLISKFVKDLKDNKLPLANFRKKKVLTPEFNSGLHSPSVSGFGCIIYSPSLHLTLPPSSLLTLSLSHSKTSSTCKLA